MSANRDKYPFALRVDFILWQLEEEKKEDCTLPLIKGATATEGWQLTAAMCKKLNTGEAQEQIEELIPSWIELDREV